MANETTVVVIGPLDVVILDSNHRQKRPFGLNDRVTLVQGTDQRLVSTDHQVGADHPFGNNSGDLGDSVTR